MSRTPPGSPVRPRFVDTPVHRISRRQLGLSPEYGLLSSDAPRRQVVQPQVMTQPVASQVTLHQPRTPAVFRGEAFEDVEDWLEQFERVASFNQWNPQQKLGHVYYSLDDGARTWYENREARGELSTWDEFRWELLESFACTDRRDLAQRLLESRIQKPNETVAMFAEDMARLFRRADPDMSEPKKLRHLMHGVKEQLFSGLVRNPPRTVKDFIKEATAIERALQERCRQYDRGAGRSSSPTGTVVTAASTDGSLRQLVRSIVREELQLHGLVPPGPASASVVDIVRQEIRQALTFAAPEQQPQPLQAGYASAVRRQPPPASAPAPNCMPQADVCPQAAAAALSREKERPTEERPFLAATEAADCDSVALAEEPATAAPHGAPTIQLLPGFQHITYTHGSWLDKSESYR
ncbi:uncharacterized protein LOC144168166 [Haemaphysalis longicornis]